MKTNLDLDQIFFIYIAKQYHVVLNQWTDFLSQVT